MSDEQREDGMLVTDQPIDLPDVLDLLIVGGGPAGTAAAFRAKELGMSALVIDYDDILKKIRDFGKGKEVKPDYGPGDKMKFPKGGELISLLHFGPSVAHDLYEAWKGYYRTKSIPAQVGVELLGLDRNDDGSWTARTYNHNTKAEQPIKAKYVVIAIGRGVPRRFDIPGNTDGISYRLTDPSLYVGKPACITGGGTSAAEAVLSISNAKVGAEDKSAVYWCYRSASMPKVSAALADEFFNAFVRNGNIRYCPNSDPVAVVSTGDTDLLSIRVDRKSLPDRPDETSHLEFPKESCIACIGEEIPEAFLESLGLAKIVGGPKSKKRIAVTPFLESRQAGVFQIGEMLCVKHLETTDFDGDPAAWEEKPHEGNIKSALIDGVFVAEVVAQKLAGKDEIDVKVEFEEAPAAAVAPVPAGDAPADPVTTIEMAVMPEAPPARGFKQAFITNLFAREGQPDEFPLNMDGVTTIGRKYCDIVFPEDDLLGDRHASISQSGDTFTLRDDGASGGTFFRVRSGEALPLKPGTLVRAGQQYLMYREDNSLQHFDKDGKEVSRYPVAGSTTDTVMGRERADIILNAEDKTLSRRHLSIGIKDGVVRLKDLGSTNGTYVRIQDSVTLRPGDEFRLGRQSFQLNVHETQVGQPLHVSTRQFVAQPAPQPAAPEPQPAAPAPAPAPQPQPEAPQAPPPAAEPAPEPAAQPAGGGAMTVTFKNTGASVPFQAGQSVYEIASAGGVPIKADCKKGQCGIDPIKILAGQENLNDVGPVESETLEDQWDLEPGEYRLACMAKPTGAIEVEILED